jgi:hypothetical protein
MTDPSATYSPKQREIVEGLFGQGQPRPRFDLLLAKRLATWLSTELQDTAAEVGMAGAGPAAGGPAAGGPAAGGPGRLVVGKFTLSAVLACDGMYAAREREPFAWSVPSVRGRVAHWAIERHILDPSWSGGASGHAPLDLVERAVARLAEDESRWGPGQYLRTLDCEDRLDLIRDAADVVTKFVQDWPPIARSWAPRTESPIKFSFHGGRVELNARPDLILGRPQGCEARTLIVDFKTGRPAVSHRADVSFYALAETLARGLPPFRVATYYLDSGVADTEDITEEVLWAQAQRVALGAARMARARRAGREPDLSPNALCPYCPAFATCGAGQESLGSFADPPADLVDGDFEPCAAEAASPDGVGDDPADDGAEGLSLPAATVEA